MNSNLEHFPNAFFIGTFGTGTHFFSRALSLVSRVDGSGRDAIEEPRQAAVAPMTLEQALSGIRDEFMPGCAVPFRVFIKGRPRAVDPAIQQQIYPIAREALLNALRHSQATSIEAEVDYVGRRLRVVVRDNGRGFEAHIAQDARRGLRGMRERARSIGAGLRIYSGLGAGTEVEISVPDRMTVAACA